MNILIIDNSNGFTGAFKCALTEALLLSDHHHFIFLIPSISTNIQLLHQQGFTVYTLPLKEISRSFKNTFQYPFYLLSNISKLKSIIKKEHIDAVQVNDFYNLLGAGLIMTGSNIKLLTYVRFLPSSLPSLLRSFWAKAAQRYSDKVIAVSDAVYQQLPKKKNTVRIYDVVNLHEKLSYKPFSNQIKSFLFLANFTRGKGQEYALQAFAKAYAINRNIRITFAGGDLGLKKNRLFRKELEEETTRLKLNDVVVIKSFDPDLEKLMKDSYALLNFSEAESFSMTCSEASYFGTPVIATRCGGPEEIIVDNITGLLVNKKDVDGMMDAMLKLANDTVLRNQFSLAARDYVRKKFSEETYKEQFFQLLEKI